MTLVRWDPFRALRSWPFEDEDWNLSSWSAGTGDNLEVSEDEDKVTVKANVAGIDEKDVDVTFQDGRLWIKAAKTEEDEDKKAKFYRKMSRSYSYVVDLPNVRVDGEPTSADIEKGVLTLVFEKAAEAKPKKIAVKSK